VLLLTKDAYFLCEHEGRANPNARQGYVTINAVPILVHGDPVGRTVHLCPNFNPPMGQKPCTVTKKVLKGYSTFIRISGRPICLSSVEGKTEGTPAGQVRYFVQRSGQDFIRASA
jgi:hypothetical protein